MLNFWNSIYERVKFSNLIPLLLVAGKFVIPSGGSRSRLQCQKPGVFDKRCYMPLPDGMQTASRKSFRVAFCHLYELLNIIYTE